ncbi:ABC transporter substrate-binding protein [Nitratireductor mangrovi]|uniref:ABC transporter substrate-binding protein n=1 Tax=Nitratireductor mangrovi TaxID=2599600 RepID=A0A5B8L4R5_9HYPH|nr:ABC transporter substrate-binding protein [Nitratireductor mangrovi]QDZ02680.1 ABC transporter substrate-binding protein [Nitratireductor mangrovi]
MSSLATRLGVRVLFLSSILLVAAQAGSAAAEEPPALKEAVASGELPPMAERLPDDPRVIDLSAQGKSPGRYGGTLTMLMSNAKDIRMMTIYGYSRLVGFNDNLDLVPDILQSFEVEEGRIFTLKLRPGHRWSDGHPFTAEDFRYSWEDVETDPDLSRSGPSQVMLVDGEPPVFEVVDDLTVRYTWSKPNPQFLPSLAGASPNYIAVPAHYLRQFHKKHTDAAELDAKVAEAAVRDWVALHTVKARAYRPENPDLPTLEPWMNTTPPPAERFLFKRNPYFHRADSAGNQLPYIDEIFMGISSEDIIPAKTGSGDSDLQARYLRFDNYTFLKQGGEAHNFEVKLWRDGTGSQVAYLPNLNVNDAGWRELFRDVRFRRALSLAINREEINQQFYFGLAHPAANTVLEGSPLFKPEYDQAWAQHDVELANKLLDEIGLERGDGGIRKLPDGRPAEIIIEMAGGTEESDVTQLVSEYWKAIGIKVFPRAMQLDNLRRRFLAGDTMMSIWSGLNIGLATADMPPEELAPVSSVQGNWPKWGQYVETGGKAGEMADLPEVQKLSELFQSWRTSSTTEERRAIWHEMLAIYTDQVYTIGTVNGVLQPVVVRKSLNNVPDEGIYAFSPVAYFGVYMPDTFWFSAGD